jgi:hypothetical protein
METMTGNVLTPPFLVLSKGAQVMMITKRHPEGRPVGAATVSVPGISKPRLDAALAGQPDPDDLTLDESLRLVRRKLISDEGRPKMAVYATVVAVILIVWICVAGSA